MRRKRPLAAARRTNWDGHLDFGEIRRAAAMSRGALIVPVLAGESYSQPGQLTCRKSAKKRPALPTPPAKMVH